MRTLINTTDYSDCMTNDFDHYFRDTAMVWSLPETDDKRRVFVPGALMHDANGKYWIPGNYLTKLREWKPKKIAFNEWHKQLKPVSIRDMYFQCGAGVALYCPDLRRNLKKSVRWNYQGIQLYGNIKAEDQSAQGYTYWAFRDLYERNVPNARSLGEILVHPNENLSAEADARGFIVTRTAGGYSKINYRGKKIGTWNDGSGKITFSGDASSLWISYLKNVEKLQEYGVKLT